MEGKTGLHSYEYSNSIGVIFRDSIKLYYLPDTGYIHLDKVRNIAIRKKRKFGLNMLLLCAMALLLGSALLCDDTAISYLLMSMSAGTTLAALLVRTYKYKLVLILEREVLEAEVEPALKNEAKIFVSKTTKKIKKDFLGRPQIDDK